MALTFRLPATSPPRLAVRQSNDSGSMWRLSRSHPKARGLYTRIATDQWPLQAVFAGAWADSRELHHGGHHQAGPQGDQPAGIQAMGVLVLLMVYIRIIVNFWF